MPINLSTLNPEVLIFGGLTLGLLYALWVIYQSNKRYFNHTGKIIQNNTEAWNKNTGALQKLTDMIERFHEKK